jgi:hypothetical protein
MSKAKKDKFYWLRRHYAGEALVQVWLIRRDGAAEFAFLHGNMPPEHADEIKAQFPEMEWKEEERNLAPYHPVPVLKTCKQPDLFDGVEQ